LISGLFYFCRKNQCIGNSLESIWWQECITVQQFKHYFRSFSEKAWIGILINLAHEY